MGFNPYFLSYMFIEQAFRGKTDFWRYLIGSLIIAIVASIGQLPLLFAVLLKSGFDPMALQADRLMQTLDKNSTTFFILISFAIGFIGLWVALKFLHEINLKTITTTRKKVDWKRVLLGFSLVGIFTSVSVLVSYQMTPGNYIWNFKPDKFLILFVMAIVLVPIQTSLEEFIFRGYLMQGFGVLAKNRWFPLIMTSLIFGLLHIANPEVGKMGYSILIFYIGTGLFLGIITLMDEGTELALGFHAANNLIAILLVTADWTAFQSESVLIDIADPTVTWDTFLPLIILYPIYFIIMAKVYKWKNWKEKLTGKIQVPVPEQNQSI